MPADTNRRRLAKADTNHIHWALDAFCKANGYTWDRPSIHHFQLWDADNHWIGSFQWIKKKGWRFNMAHLYAHTPADLHVALDMVKDMQDTREVAEDLWGEYQKSKSEWRWLRYWKHVVQHVLRTAGEKQLITKQAKG